MINKSHTTNFNTLCDAIKNGDVCLMEGKRKKDGEIVNLICAVYFDGKEYAMTPFAEMVSGNPFEDYYPPAPDGGFFEVG
jgi:uncharacterized protein YrrD